MRRLFLLVLLGIALGMLAACNRSDPQVVLEAEQLDLGDVHNGAVVRREVPVRNAGDAVLVIDEITTSCGCTTAELEPMQLAPGEQGVLHIAFDSGAHGPDLTGPMVRQVFIDSNDPARPTVTVALAVTVTAREQAGFE